MARYEDLPYRACVGVMLLNKDGMVFIGRRIPRRLFEEGLAYCVA